MKNIFFIFQLLLIGCVLSLSNMDAFIMGPEYDLEFESGDTEENFLLMNDTIVDFILDGLKIDKKSNNTLDNTVEISVKIIETDNKNTENLNSVNPVILKKEIENYPIIVTSNNSSQKKENSQNKTASSENKTRSEIEILSKNDSMSLSNTFLRNPIIPDPIANELGKLNSKSDIVNLIISILTISLFSLIFIGLLLILISKTSK